MVGTNEGMSWQQEGGVKQHLIPLDKENKTYYSLDAVKQRLVPPKHVGIVTYQFEKMTPTVGHPLVRMHLTNFSVAVFP